MKIKKGDTIKIISGKDKGKMGKVIKVISEKNRVMAEGLNLYKKHVRPKKQGEKGETVMLPRSIEASNVMIICSSCKETARFGCRLEDGQKTRVCKKCGGIMK